MIYFPWHIGDYAAHTGHLEPLEDLIYRRLLEAYYLHEAPIPVDIPTAAKLIRLRTMADLVGSVLEEFFDLTPDGWRHSRCDAELAKMLDKQAKARASGQASASARRAKNEQSLDSEEAAVQRSLASIPTDVQLPTPTPTPTPVDKRPVVNAVALIEPQPTAKRSARQCPESFLVDGPLQKWAREKVPGLDIRYETEKFRDHTFSTARTNWAATWRAWMRKAFEDRGKRNGSTEPAWRTERRERIQSAAPFAAARPVASAADFFDDETPALPNGISET